MDLPFIDLSGCADGYCGYSRRRFYFAHCKKHIGEVQQAMAGQPTDRIRNFR
jgi:hypothetical protein